MSATVFLGLVTHRGTRFPDSSGPTGLMASTARTLDGLGVRCITSISDEDSFDGELVALDRASVLASIAAELDTEARWRAYVSPDSSRAALRMFMAVRSAYRRLRLAPPWRRQLHEQDAGARMLRRLVNIELSHLRLMRQALSSGSDWALILEDDAAADDPEEFATALASFVAERTAAPQPRYVNVSRSFSEERLRIDAHLATEGSWGAAAGVSTLGADRPVTNTVCAILYRTDFLADLLAVLEGIPLTPVLPIDWKLNEAILRMVAAGTLGPGDCWFLSPAPVIQRSMVAGDAG